MATTYKTFSANDIVSTRTLLHEAIPLTGTIVSGTYADNNIKNYTHGMFQSVYDYPYLSSSANHIFDLSVGLSTVSSLTSSTTSQKAKKVNVYNQMAQVLAGFDADGAVRRFDKDGDLVASGDKLDEVIFINFSRLLTKDEIKKGTFSLELDVDPTFTAAGNAMSSRRIKLLDHEAENNYFINSPAGDYAVLYATSSLVQGSQANLAGEQLGTAFSKTAASGDSGFNPAVGLLFYQAGIAVISGSIFQSGQAQCQIRVVSNTPANFDSPQTSFTLESADSTSRTYEFAVGGALATGEVVTGTTIRVQVQSLSTHEQIATQIKNAIENSNGHGTSKFTCLLSTSVNTNDTVTVRNVTAGTAGNKAIAAIGNGNASELTINGGIAATSFVGGHANALTHLTGAANNGSCLLSHSADNPIFENLMTGSEISASADAIRHRIFNIEFNNTTELNSTVYFCRAHHNEFNYSTNPTYLSSSKIVVKNLASDSPVAYITGVGLYSSDNELLASAKVSEPLRKDPTNELTLRVRLDY